jgi:hypothetical protein
VPGCSAARTWRRPTLVAAEWGQCAGSPGIEVRIQCRGAKGPGLQRTWWWRWWRWFRATRWMNDRPVTAKPRFWAGAGFGWPRLDLMLALLLRPQRIYQQQRVDRSWPGRAGRRPRCAGALRWPVVDVCRSGGRCWHCERWVRGRARSARSGDAHRPHRFGIATGRDPGDDTGTAVTPVAAMAGYLTRRVDGAGYDPLCGLRAARQRR